MGTKTYTLREIADRLEGRLRGDPDRVIRGARGLAEAGAEDLSFLANPKYRRLLATTRAAALLVAEGQGDCYPHTVELADPYLGFAQLLELFYGTALPVTGVHPLAVVDPAATVGPEASIHPLAVVEAEAVLGERATLHPGAVVGRGVRVGDRCTLHPHVVLYPGTTLGDGVTVHAGTVIGSDGFGYAWDGERHRKILQVGQVVIEDDVEIGANVTIDRAATGTTRIGRGCRIDNLVQIGHGTQLGPHTILVAQSGLSGSVTVGTRAVFAGHAGAVGHVTVGDGVQVGAKSAVTKDVPAGQTVMGFPATPERDWKRQQALIRRLPELWERIRALEATLGEADRDRSETPRGKRK